MEDKKKYHPAPADQKENPGKLVEVEYLVDVTAPDFKAGKKGETKQLEQHWALQLTAEGFAKLKGAVNGSDSGSDSEGG